MNNHLKRTLSLLLALVLAAGLLSGLTISASALTLEERQQAVVASALAYFDKGHSVQYSGETLCDNISRSDGGKTRSTNQVSPEYATPQETMFTVCSDFAHQVYYETFHYQLTGSAGRCWTGTLVKTPKDDPISVWYFNADEGMKQEEEVEKMFGIAQPGDVLTVFTGEGGHTMVWAGDLYGDGVQRIIHSGGSHMKDDLDVREYKNKDDPEVDTRYGTSFGEFTNGGSIRINDAQEYVRSHYMKPNWRYMNLLRPAKVMTDADYINPAALYRVKHPRLAIDRYLNKTRFNSAFTGETVTMTLKLSNSSDKAYTVPVTEKVPAGAKVKKAFEGATTSGDTMKWNVELKAGDVKTFTCEYEITAALGDQVVFEGGSVGDIPSNVIPIQVGGKKLTDEEKAKLAAIAKGEYLDVLKEAKASNVTMADVVYQKILGLGVTVADAKTVSKKFIKAVKSEPSGGSTNVFVKKDAVAAEDLTAYRMLVPTCWGGFAIWNRFGIERCSDPRDKHLEPGDVVVRTEHLNTPRLYEQMLYLGDGKYLTCTKAGKTYEIVEEPEFFRCLLKKAFYVLRPTLAYEDVHTLPALADADKPAETKLKFTDVKESDWFYEYVSDLVEDGTVNGMTETTFVPNGTLTYGQALKLITLAVGEREQEKTGTHWASGYLKLAKDKKWLTEDVDLDGTVTRLAFCKIAAKAKKLTHQPPSNPFDDTKDLDVLALYKVGVINGMTKNTFQPDGLLTRAQISKIIWSLRKLK